MSWNPIEEQRIRSIEYVLNNVQRGLNHASTRQEYKSLLVSLQKELIDLTTRIQQVEAIDEQAALSLHEVSTSAHVELNDRYFIRSSFLDSVSGSEGAGHPVLLNSNGKLDPDMVDITLFDHGGLSGLNDDDHTIYFRQDGTRAMLGPIFFGGDSSVYPAIYQNGNSLNIRLADDSDYTDIYCNQLHTQDGLVVGTNQVDIVSGLTNNTETPNPTSVSYYQRHYVPPYDTATENASIYARIDHRPGETDFRYWLYGEITEQSIVGGSFTKIMHRGAGDAHYVAHLGNNTSSYGYESAMFGGWQDPPTNSIPKQENGFIATFQGSGGFQESVKNQSNSVCYQALVHDDGVDPTSPNAWATNYGLFYANNALSNAFVVRASEFAQNYPMFKLMDHTINQRPIWAVYADGQTWMNGEEATASAPLKGSPPLLLKGHYWDGSAEQVNHTQLSHQAGGAGGGVFRVDIGNPGSETLAFQVTESGDCAVGRNLLIPSEPTLNTHAVTKHYVDSFAVSATQESFTIQMDSVNGTDPSESITIANQTQANAWGPIKTVAAAIRAIPEFVHHDITLQFPVGEWQLSSNDLLSEGYHVFDQNLSPYYGGYPNFIVLAGDDSWEQITGTADMNVSSWVAYPDSVITLTANPGLITNAYTGYYLLVMSGTGSGSRFPIRYNDGSTITLATLATTTLDNTSVVRIVKRATTLLVHDNVWNDDQQIGGNCFKCDAINIESKNSKGAINSFLNGYMELTNASRVVNLAIIDMQKIFIKESILYAKDWPYTHIKAGSIQCWGRSIRLFIGAGITSTHSIGIIGTTVTRGGTYINLAGTEVFQDYGSSYLRVARGTMNFGKYYTERVISDQLAPYAIHVEDHSTIKIPRSLSHLTFKGASGDVEFYDNTVINWTEVENYSAIVGSEGSRIVYDPYVGDAKILQLGNQEALSFIATDNVTVQSDKQATVAIKMKSETLTFSGDSTKTTASNIIPHGAFVVGVTGRVNTEFTGCTDLDIGISGDTDIFAAGIALTAGTTFDNTNATAVLPNPSLSNQEIVVTANGGPATAGVISLTVHYLDITAAVE